MSAKLEVSLSVIDQATKELKAIGRQFNNLQNQIVGFAKATAGALGGGAIMSGFISDMKMGYEASKNLAAANIELSTSLGYESNALKQQQKLMQDKYLVDQKDTATAQERLASFGIEAEWIEKLTPAVLNLAKAKGLDLAQAAELVGRNLGTDTAEFKKYHIELDGTANSTERMQSMIDGINKKMGNQADALREIQGPLEQGAMMWKSFWRAVATPLRSKTQDEYFNSLLEFHSSLLGSEKMLDIATNALLEKQMQGFKNVSDKKKEMEQKDIEDSKAGWAGISLDPGKKQREEDADKAARQAKLDQREFDKQFLEDVKKDEENRLIDDEAYYKKQEEQDKKALEFDKEIAKAHIENDKDVADALTKIEEETLAIQKKQVDTAMAIGEQLGSAFSQGIEEGKFDVKKALKALLDTIVDALEKQALAAVASNTLQKIDEGGMEYGLIIGAVEAAAIMAVGSLAKSAISSFAGGTSYAPGGMAMVGERGPELMHVPQRLANLHARSDFEHSQ